MRTIRNKLAILGAALALAGALVLAPTGPAGATGPCRIEIQGFTAHDLQESTDEIYFKVDGRRPDNDVFVSLPGVLGHLILGDYGGNVSIAGYVELWESDFGPDDLIGLPVAVSCADLGDHTLTFREPGVHYTASITVSPYEAPPGRPGGGPATSPGSRPPTVIP